MPGDETATAPAYDRELLAAAERLRSRPTLSDEKLRDLRRVTVGESVEAQLGADVASTEMQIPGFDAAPLTVLITGSRRGDVPSPAIVNFHGGGMVMGDRRVGLWLYRDAVADSGATIISVEYRLAPEHPHPVPVEDCFAALRWVDAHAETIGVDRERLVVAGMSAGGALAAGVALLARDRNGPAIRGALLAAPMLDDRERGGSRAQYPDSGPWPRSANATAWRALLGDAAGTTGVPAAAAPARAGDLSNLPAFFLDCGSADILRDETVAFAERIWAAGGDAELHIWPGGFHGFEKHAPDAAISRAARDTRRRWITRILSRADSLTK